MSTLAQQVMNDLATTPGKLYFLGLLLGLISFVFSISDGVKTLYQDKAVNVDIFISYFLLCASLLLKFDYLNGKILSQIVIVTWFIGFLITGIIYLIAYIKYNKNHSEK